MKEAIKNAIYYVDNTSNNTEDKYNIVTNITYDGTKPNFREAITKLYSNVKVRMLFGNNDNICYHMLYYIGRSFDTLLVGELDNIIIITRNDNAIQISKNIIIPDDIVEVDIKNIKGMTGIIRIDAVLAELNITEATKGSGLYNLLYWVGVFGLIYWGSSISEQMQMLYKK